MMNIRKLSFLAIVCAWFVCVSSFAQEKPSLQTLFNEYTPEMQAKNKISIIDNPIIIDLDEWKNEYDETLNIATGKRYRFTNGELKWIGGDAPLITVSNGSRIEFADDTKVYSTVRAYSPLILLKGNAQVTVDGGYLEASIKPQQGLYGVFTYMDAIQIDPETDSNRVTIFSGEILGSITNDSPINNTIYFYRGRVGGVKCESSIYVSGESYISNPDHYHTMYDGIDLGKNGIAELSSGYISPSISPSGLQMGTGTWCSQFSIDLDNCNGREIVRGYGYQITQEDLSKIKVNGLDMEKYDLVLEDNKVIIREKSLTGQQWLQEQINSYVNITTDTDEQPGVITIPEEGIELTTLLMVPKGAFVKLVGGPITISKNFDQRPDFAVHVYDGAHLYIDNTWDFNSLPLHIYAYIFANNGHLSFGEYSTLLNTWSETSRKRAFIGNTGGRLYFNNPNSDAYGSEVRINGSFVDGQGLVDFRDGDIVTKGCAITAGNCYIYGGSIDSSEGAVKAVEFYMCGGVIATSADKGIDVTAATLKGGIFHFTTSYVGLITSSGDIRDHTIVFNDCIENYNCLNLTSKLSHKQHIRYNWEKMDFSSPFVAVRGHEYQLTQEDCDNCVFDDLPSGVRAKLDGNTIVLTKEEPDLHDLFDKVKDKGTEDEPTNLMGDEDEVSTDESEDMKDDLHILFGDPEDKEDGTDSTRSFSLYIGGGDYGIKIPATSSLEFKNINIDLGESGINSFIEVYGKLIINVNVYIRNVCTCTKQVIYVRPGGTLIWRGGINNIPGVVIYNDGGTVIYEGGDTYGSFYGIYNVNGGNITIKGGSIGGGEFGIYNPSSSEVHIYDGTVVNGGIYSNGNITTGGNVGISPIYIPWNSRINVTSRITTNWIINIINMRTIKVPTPFIYGTGGYKLTEEDLKRIETNLPEKYCLILDIKLNIIYIVDSCTDSIDGITKNDTNVIENIYSIDGKQNDNKRGMKIIRYSDGTIHKVIQK